MDRGNIWITVGIILLLSLCHTLLTGIYPVRTLFPTIKETIDDRTNSRRNLRKRTIDRRTANVGSLRVISSHNGQLLAKTRHHNWNEPNQIELMSFKDGSIVHTLEGFGNLGGFVFSPDGSLIAACTNNDIYIWRTGDGQLLRKLPTPYFSGPSVGFSADGKKLVSVIKEQIVAWDVTSGQRLYSLDVHEQIVSTSPGGKFFAVVSRSSVIQLYYLDDGTLLRQLSITGSPQFVSDDKILINTAKGSGYRVLFYQITSDTTSPVLFGLNSNLPTGGISSPDGRFLLGGVGGRDVSSGGDLFMPGPTIQKPKVAAYILWQIDGPYPLPLKKFFVRSTQSLRSFTPDSKFFLAGGDLFSLPLVHPWLVNTLVMVGVATVIFFADRFPPIR